MEKPILDGHPSVVIAHCPDNNKLLMAVYDSSYPQVSYRFSANNIGGNPDCKKHPEDTCPINVLLREVGEEYDPDHGEKTKFGETVLWAPQNHISLIRDSLFYITPFQDFLVTAAQLLNDPTTHNYTAIYSAFYASIPEETIEIAEENIRKCRRLSPEGLTGVFTLDELANDPIKRNLSTAHATAPILNYYFHSLIPFPSQLRAIVIGPPRNNFTDYLADFQYAGKIAKATGIKDE